ncbi:Myosin light chain alkali [Folsomia candida]|uniref:Myosin light chain alkali n=1 Tax=Folsomia candida TaxID=158441 RepID=A0A226D5P6_FOLCA|nr:Myosin light chain alkali [Folsomia candida]
MALDLSARDIERAKFAFSIYDFEGNDTVDAFDMGSVLRSLGLIPTQKSVEKFGGQKKKGEKLELEEVDEIIKDCAVPPDEDGFTPYGIFLDKLMAGPYKEED